MKGSVTSWMKIGILMDAGVGVMCTVEVEAEQSRQRERGKTNAHYTQVNALRGPSRLIEMYNAVQGQHILLTAKIIHLFALAG